MQLLERYTSIMGESRLFFYCNSCDRGMNTGIEYFEQKPEDRK